ncbi:hypothetical protein FNO01nite_10180 [Flavobacterium noncentrifugens]|uniref:Acetyltransferase (GNAT) domain-containing protein n=1 Tax=Flavobacterium noncentrifugens TaxID=1128970 RepID=A0A1G8V7M7_9FLAO|nr:GNAT family N-acetyltransferase [Flavobacterium noncentrifugens]GEP50346.1 hypothetical protein FNO01nite_10180 [Flavobacterium noncentrifugens]SDJ61170.1 Acetyltransferase (GNAT) domain-containing protein [Flavobacterium noncentrifugens]
MEIINTKDAEWLKKWDAFILSENRGSHLLLTDWVKSFRSYGFDYEMAIFVENGIIRGGFAAIIAKVAMFRFYIVPYGPIVTKDFEYLLDDMIAHVKVRAKTYKSCYCHITLPHSDLLNSHLYHDLPALPSVSNAKEGHLFKYVYSSNGLNWVGLKQFEDEESLLNNFRPSVRRYIRSSLRKELQEKFLTQHDEVKRGYDLCLENARKHQYSLRSWEAFKETLLAMIQDGTAKFIGAFQGEDLKGAALVIRAGNYNTYILGGTKKEKPDVLAGHFLHWKAIEMSFRENLSGYNISLGGSKGVVDLKNSYAEAQLYFTDSKYHWVLKPAVFKAYLFFEKHLKPHKKIISKVLSTLTKRNDK